MPTLGSATGYASSITAAAGGTTNATYSAGRPTTQTQHKITWLLAQITGLGAGLTGDVKICTLPAKTIVKNAYVVINTPAAAPGLASCTVALGRTGAGYIDYIVASDAMAVASTVYGDATAERGANLTGYDMPSFAGTTDVFAHFIAVGANLDTFTASAGTIYLITSTLV